MQWRGGWKTASHLKGKIKKNCLGDLLLESKKVSKVQKEGGEAKISERMCEKFIRYRYLFTQLHTIHLSLCVHT